MNIDKIRKNFLSKQQTDDKVASVLKTVLAVCQPLSVIVFGSAARYELTPSSDVDVVIVLENPAQLQAAKKSVYAKSAELGFPVDFLLVDKETYERKSQIGGALFDARTEGRIIFERQ